MRNLQKNKFLIFYYDRYLKEFQTVAQYAAAESSLVLPNVSLITETNGVVYKPLQPTPSHDYVEIGGVKWATMNIGANSITDTCLYFQWGDTQGYTAAQVGSGEGQKYFGWADYKFNPSGDGSTFTKYNSTDGKTTLESSDDAVTAAWGGNWRMPTVSEFIALGDVCSTAWTTTYEGSTSGMLLTVTADTADNGKQLFFPACGCAYNGSVDGVGSYGNLWSSSLVSDHVDYAYYIGFDGSSVGWNYNFSRYYGYPVRGVLDE